MLSMTSFLFGEANEMLGNVLAAEPFPTMDLVRLSLSNLRSVMTTFRGLIELVRTREYRRIEDFALGTGTVGRRSSL